ncbi:sensor histidine kinase [Agaribacter flavus]|uniref:histidine kinase n=1 Tax=Agaribacter flavus TaxID=1902781 RepID=A0ABV7FUM6_9ALTE
MLHRLYLCVVLIALCAAIPLFWFANLSLHHIALVGFAIVLGSLIVARYLLADFRTGIEALELGMLNMKDGEFSTSLSYHKNDEFGKLCELYNETVEHLRTEKHWLYQRELLLDKVTQSSPDVLFLTDSQGILVFSNIAARDFFASKVSLEGSRLDDLVDGAPLGFESIVDKGTEGLFTLTPKQQESQTWHISKGNFSLNNHPHTLFILKQMTRELSRQEVAVWKKVIRVISHELNNSLGPISSMIHSGKLLTEHVDDTRLERVFSTIDERIKHLSEFVQGYGKFAKLPEPNIRKLDWQSFVQQLAEQWYFRFDTAFNTDVQADPIQLEQLLINLLKNAHESGGDDKEVSIHCHKNNKQTVIEVSDRGKGMSEEVLSSALIPFYSTKSSGTGLGLALCREIMDAHHGHIALQNRANGGLTVRLVFPDF